MNDIVFKFGPFQLIPAERLVLDDGKPLRLGSRALAILIGLIERAGEIVRTDELIARVWPDTMVVEGALRVHVAALRKVLGDGRDGNRFIANVPGRGYSFVGSVRLVKREPPAALNESSATAEGCLPASLTRIIGRDRVIGTLTKQIARRRLLTIVGPGGVGKTTVASAVAAAASPAYVHGAWFVELSSLTEPELVPMAFSAAFGISLPRDNPVSGLTEWLNDKDGIIVVDGCEHVIGVAATIAEAILKTAPKIRILATSREPMRAEGEWLHRLASLELPPDAVGLTAEEALQYAAVELFNERAIAMADGFVLSDTDVPAVIEICRSLGGLPLALELAAAQVDDFGVKGLGARLDDRFAVLKRGRRTALPRHQTLRATMDWSHALLPQVERIILRRLAVFPGDFTMDAAAAVVADESISAEAALEGIANLTDKSLVATDNRGELTRHRLLDTTRLYALEKLKESDEHAQLVRRLAESCRSALDDEWNCRTMTDRLPTDTNQLGNVRGARAAEIRELPESADGLLYEGLVQRAYSERVLEH